MTLAASLKGKEGEDERNLESGNRDSVLLTADAFCNAWGSTLKKEGF